MRRPAQARAAGEVDTIMLRKSLAFSVLGLVLAAGSAWAGAPARGSIDVDVLSATSVAGQALPEGRYNISWVTEGDATKVVFKSGQTRVEATARFAERQEAAPEHTIVSRASANGKAVAEVRLRGRKDVIVLESKS
jgi:hypothetical protein